MLTPSGVRQHAEMAEKFIRGRYATKLDFMLDPFGTDFKAVNQMMMIRSTQLERTIDSAWAQFGQLFTENADNL